jgi:hypothetical protein
MTSEAPMFDKKSPYSIRMVNGEPFFFIPVTHKSDQSPPAYDSKVDYNALCRDMTTRNTQATQQLQALILEYKNLSSKLERLQEHCMTEVSVRKRKRHRRAADEIDRHFTCQQCGKAYGSEGSLNQHAKLKHAG